MNTTYSFHKVARTWAMIFSVPLYIGGTSLWLKEEIKDVVNEKEAQMLSSIKEEMKKSLAHKKQKQQTFLLP
ncbi:hypothetical protein [Rufibacter radiotolerans]|nr:hypothetical protein [Rufibacter radiotolerans]